MSYGGHLSPGQFTSAAKRGEGTSDVGTAPRDGLLGFGDVAQAPTATASATANERLMTSRVRDGLPRVKAAI
jgi:hypothetical protein